MDTNIGYEGQSMIKVPLKNSKDSLLRTQIHLFLHFFYDMF
jgi:hypothetical protein